MGFEPGSIFAVSGYLWIILSIVLFIAIYEQHASMRMGPRRILLFLYAGTLLRMLWFFFNFSGNSSLSLMAATNRLAICFQLTGISLLVLIWAKSVTDVSFHINLVKICVTFNVVVYIVMVITGIIFYNNNDAYFINILFICFISLVSVAFVFTYSLALRIKLTTVQCRELEAVVKKLTRVSGILSICFFLRSICFAYSPITGNSKTPVDWINSIIYPWFFYQIPELIPAVVIIISIAPRVSVFRKREGGYDTESVVNEHEVLVHHVESPIHNHNSSDDGYTPSRFNPPPILYSSSNGQNQQRRNGDENRDENVILDRITSIEL